MELAHLTQTIGVHPTPSPPAPRHMSHGLVPDLLIKTQEESVFKSKSKLLQSGTTGSGPGPVVISAFASLKKLLC